MSELKKILIILLTLFIFLQPFCKAWVFISFKINQDFIAKNLCENRTKPSLHCDGKCHLMKKLKQVDKEEKKQTSKTIKEKLEDLAKDGLLRFGKYGVELTELGKHFTRNVCKAFDLKLLSSEQTKKLFSQAI